MYGTLYGETPNSFIHIDHNTDINKVIYTLHTGGWFGTCLVGSIAAKLISERVDIEPTENYEEKLANYLANYPYRVKHGPVTWLNMMNPDGPNIRIPYKDFSEGLYKAKCLQYKCVIDGVETSIYYKDIIECITPTTDVFEIGDVITQHKELFTNVALEAIANAFLENNLLVEFSRNFKSGLSKYLEYHPEYGNGDVLGWVKLMFTSGSGLTAPYNVYRDMCIR